MNKNKIINYALCIVLLIICLGGIFHYIEFNQEKFIKTKFKIDGIVEEDNIVSNCMNYDLDETALCLISNIETFYSFKVTNGDLTFYELKNNGGDCRNYALLYADLGKKLGFNSDSFVIEKKEKNHRFALISDDTGYCILDMLYFKCFHYKGYYEKK